MSFSALFAKFVALIGSVLIVWRRATTPQPSQAIGQAPSIPLPRSQGVLPTLKMPTAKGWTAVMTQTILFGASSDPIRAISRLRRLSRSWTQLYLG